MRFELEHVEQPWADRPVDDEEQRLADALLRTTPIPGEMWELLAAHGLALLGGEGTLPEGVIRLRRPKQAQEGPLSASESRGAISREARSICVAFSSLLPGCC